MLRWNAVFLIFCLAGNWLRAGEPLYMPHGSVETGLAFAVTATPGHWSCFNNQALLTAASGTSFSASFESRFMMPALSSKAISAVIDSRPAPLGVVVTYYGNGDYYRLFTGAGSAVRLTDGISVGIQVDCLSEHGAGEYRDVTHVTVETGLACTLAPSLTFGLHIFNPLAPLNSLPSSIETGLHWRQSDDLFLTLAGSKMTGEPLSAQCGISWSALDRLTLRCGYMSSPSSFALGLGCRAGSVLIDTGFLVNTITGITSSMSLVWTIK